MLIEITDLTSYEIIRILQNYPKGKLVIKNDSVFWDSVSLEPTSNVAAQQFDPRQPPRGQGNIGQSFERMADTLGRMVC
jgi:hypothetical protein